MENSRINAVITGDIVASSSLATGDQHTRLLSILESSFRAIGEILPGGIRAPFEMYRGDSFQGVLWKPKDALRAVITVRACLRSGGERALGLHALDARIAVGIGLIESFPDGRVSGATGEAFSRSGRALDSMKKGQRRILIRTTSPEVDAELDTECALLDALICKWSPRQAKAILTQIRGLTQKQAASEMGISQPAVRQRLSGAASWAVAQLNVRYEQLVSALG